MEVVSLCVPSKGIGALFEVEVTAGAAEPATDGTLPLPELTDPPTAWIDCQLPLVPEYVYCVPVE